MKAKTRATAQAIQLGQIGTMIAPHCVVTVTGQPKTARANCKAANTVNTIAAMSE